MSETKTTHEVLVDCPGCGAPAGYPPGGPCKNHGTPEAVAVWTWDEVLDDPA